MARIWRFIYSIATPLLLLLFVFSLLSFEGTYQYTHSAVQTDSTTVENSVVVLLNLTTLFFEGTDMQVNGHGKVVVNSMTMTPDGKTSADISETFQPAGITPPSLTLNVLVIVGVILFLIGIMALLIAYPNRIITCVGAAVAIVGGVLLFSTQKMFQPLTFYFYEAAKPENEVVHQVLPFSPGVFLLLLLILSAVNVVFVFLFPYSKKRS
jgi:uncharacterized membrane protein